MHLSLEFSPRGPGMPVLIVEGEPEMARLIGHLLP